MAEHQFRGGAVRPLLGSRTGPSERDDVAILGLRTSEGWFEFAVTQQVLHALVDVCQRTADRLPPSDLTPGPGTSY